MTHHARRHLLAAGTALAGGAITGCASAVTAAGGPRMPLEVARTTIPIVGSDEAFSGAAHLLHRPQRRRACPRDGLRPDPLHLASEIGHFADGAIRPKVNGLTRQNAALRHMIWSVAEQISRLSQANELQPGDIIDSGTPENEGPVVRGDVIEIHIDRPPNLGVKIV